MDINNNSSFENEDNSPTILPAPKSMREALLAELLGDVAKLHDLIKDLEAKAPQIIERNSITMRNLLQTWKTEAKLEHQRTMEQDLLRYMQELKKETYNEIARIVAKSFEHNKNVIYQIINKQFKQLSLYLVTTGVICFIAGLIISKFIL